MEGDADYGAKQAEARRWARHGSLGRYGRAGLARDEGKVADRAVGKGWAEGRRSGLPVGKGESGPGWVEFGWGFGFLSFSISLSLLFLIQTKFEFKYEFEFKPLSNKSMHQHECNTNF